MSTFRNYGIDFYNSRVAKMNVEQKTTINVSADALWKIIGTDFANVKDWAERMLDSRQGDDLGEMGGRYVTTVEYGEATETLYLFDEENRELAYSVEGNLPPVIADVTTAWRVEPDGDERSIVINTFTAKMLQPEMEEMIHGRLMAGLVPLHEQLRHFAENGVPHPDKQAQLNSA